MEIRESLETNFLTCKMCGEILQQPKVLECMHSFCLGCLDEVVMKMKNDHTTEELNKLTSATATYQSSYTRSKWSRKYSGDSSSRSTRDYSIKCATCAKRTLVPKGGCVNFPDDVLAGKLASIVGRIPKYPVCDVCSRSNEPTLSPFAMDNFLEVPGFKSDRSGGEGASSSDISSDPEVGENDSVPSSYRMRSKKRRDLKSKKKKSRILSNGPRRCSYDPKAKDGSYDEVKKNEPKRAEAACLDCAKRLCNLCQVTHSNMPVTSEHILIRVEQLDEMKCPRHSRELRRFYCKDCEICICLVCTFDAADDSPSDHSNHQVLSLKQAVDVYQDDINDASSTVQMNIEKLERVLDGLRICESHVDSVSRAIDETANELINEIKQRQESLKEEINKRLKVRKEELTKKYHSINSVIESWYELTRDDTFNQSLDFMNPLEALNEALPLVEKINEIIIETELHSEPKEPEWIMFYQKILTPPKSTESQGNDRKSDLNNKGGVLKKKKVTFKLGYEEAPPIEFWIDFVGKFYRDCQDSVNLGQVQTPNEHEEEIRLKDKLIRDSRKNLSLQCNFFEENQDDKNIQSDMPGIEMKLKIDNGTQYQSSDVNAPVSFFRGGKQIIVQK